MSEIGKLMVIVGVGLLIIGGLIWGLGKLGFRGLPGDVRYETDQVRVYFPIVTCVVLSAVLTAGAWLWHYFGRR